MVDFVDFYMKNAPGVVNDVGYVPFSTRSYNLLYQNFYQVKVNSIWGKSDRVACSHVRPDN
ncbi:MAG: hypothetical protein GDA48_20330 [Hormoscilla sp. GM102CHS1]|nr:hypothetical protein [Hormoscilla sp. GM102CHS1]